MAASSLIIIIVLTLTAYTVHSWDYDKEGNGHSEWNAVYPECGWDQQSPINLNIDFNSTICDEPLLLDWTSNRSHFVIKNTGHSLQAIPFYIDHAGGSDLGGLEVMHHTNDTAIRFTNPFYNTYTSEINQEYCFDSLHFHWGRTQSEGSEHRVNGKAFPLEMHLVHYSCSYQSAGQALKDYSSGLVKWKYDDHHVLGVIAVLFEIGAANPVLDLILNDTLIDGIMEHNHHQTDHLIKFYYQEFDPNDLMPESREMVAYSGSLTTPPCYQTVRWQVMTHPMTVSHAQISRLRLLLQSEDGADLIAPNFRSVRPLNHRKIYECQEDFDEDLVDYKEIMDVPHLDVVVDTDDWQFVAIIGFVLFGFTLIVCLAINWKCIKHHVLGTPPEPTVISVKSVSTNHKW